jgi:hypothetical protein
MLRRFELQPGYNFVTYAAWPGAIVTTTAALQIHLNFIMPIPLASLVIEELEIFLVHLARSGIAADVALS